MLVQRRVDERAGATVERQAPRGSRRARARSLRGNRGGATPPSQGRGDGSGSRACRAAAALVSFSIALFQGSIMPFKPESVPLEARFRSLSHQLALIQKLICSSSTLNVHAEAGNDVVEIAMLETAAGRAGVDVLEQAVYLRVFFSVTVLIPLRHTWYDASGSLNGPAQRIPNLTAGL